MPPKIKKAERLRQLRNWALEHAGTLGLREGSSLRERLRSSGNLPGEKSWYNFFYNNTFTAAQEADVKAIFRLIAVALQHTPAKRQRSEPKESRATH